MIAQVLRISTAFANLLLASATALSITIAVAGTIEKTTAGCYGCLTTGQAITSKPSKTAHIAPSSIRLAFGSGRIAGTL